MLPVILHNFTGQVDLVEREISNLIITVGAPAAIILGCIYLAILIVRSYSDNSRVDNQVVLTVIDLLKTGIGSIEVAIKQGNEESAKFRVVAASIDATMKAFTGKVTDLEGISTGATAAIAEHDRIAQNYIKDSSDREKETLEIVRGLPEQINAVAELFRKDALQKLQDAQDHIDRQFEAARISIDTSFANMTAALVAQAQPQIDTEQEAIRKLVASITEPPAPVNPPDGETAIVEPPVNDGETRADVVPVPSAGDGG